MSSILKLTLFIFAVTLTVPLMVWAQSTSWRTGWTAWWQFSAWIGGPLLLGVLVWAGMGAPI